LAGIETMGIQEHLPRDNARWDLTMRTGWLYVMKWTSWPWRANSVPPL
jgi:hypothetical protein